MRDPRILHDADRPAVPYNVLPFGKEKFRNDALGIKYVSLPLP